MSRGKYIVLEGVDGSGKTTQHQRLLASLGERAKGVREPGGTPMAEQVRSLIKDGSTDRSVRTNIFLFSAARTEVIDTIVRPAIEQGSHVIADRNWLSNLAYQTAEDPAHEQDIYAICKYAAKEFFEPDLIIFVDTDIDACFERMQQRGSTSQDYFDRLGKAYFKKVREIYLKYLSRMPNARIVNGTGTPDEVEKAIAQVVGEFLPAP